MQSVFWLALVVLVCGAASTPVPDPENADSYAMGVLARGEAVPSEAVPHSLVDGDFAESIADEQLTKGPQVNGGFAMNLLPINIGEKAAANADCAGLTADGRCIRMFPRRSRTATIDDNMQSPEQLTSGLYEADLHQVVRTHFGQEVMQETAASTHNVGLPGYAIMNEEMNKVGNTHADSIGEAMFPIGTTMMTDGDHENGVALLNDMNRNYVDTAPVGELVNQDNQEVAEQQPVVKGVSQETTDLETVVPQTSVDEEPGLPPTPTPTATPNLEIIRLQQEAAKEAAQEFLACSTLLEQHGYMCEGPGEHSPLRLSLEQQVEVQVQQDAKKPPVAEKAAKPFDASNIKLNFQTLIAQCSGQVASDLAAFLNDTHDEHSSVQRRASFTQKMIKYASAMACVDSDDFPSCVPSEALAIVQTPPTAWRCY